MKMKNGKKVLLIAACALLLVIGSVMGTLAYLTDSESVQNTFTVGSVALRLDEADVDLNGVVKSNERVKNNSYHLLPGRNYVKDPTVTVEEGSERSYIRMMVTVNYSSQLDAIFAPTGADLLDIFQGYDGTKWLLEGVTKDTAANTRTYEFRYKEAVAAPDADVPLAPLFRSFTVPGELTVEQLATLEGGQIPFTIDVVAHAIQAEGFADADAAWAEFKP